MMPRAGSEPQAKELCCQTQRQTEKETPDGGTGVHGSRAGQVQDSILAQAPGRVPGHGGDRGLSPGEPRSTEGGGPGPHPRPEPRSPEPLVRGWQGPGDRYRLEGTGDEPKVSAAFRASGPGPRPPRAEAGAGRRGFPSPHRARGGSLTV